MATKTHTPDIVYVEMADEHIEGAAETLANSFGHGVALVDFLGVTFEDRLELDRRMCRKCLSSGASVIAVDNSTGRIVGAAVGEIEECTVTYNVEHSKQTNTVNEGGIAVVRALIDDAEALFYQSADFMENQGCRFLISYKIGVSAGYRGMGIAVKMAKIRSDMAKKRGCKQMVVVAATLGSQSLYSKLGCRVIGEVSVEEFTFRGQKPFAGISECKVVKTMVKYL